MQIHNIFDMEAKINIFQNNAKDSNVILTSGSNEMDLMTVLNYNGNDISFISKNKTSYVNATEMGRAFGKQPSDFTKTSYFAEFIEALAETTNLRSADLLIVIKGGNTKQGTWMHPDLAIEFARWLNPRFAVWCNSRIKELMKNGICVLPDFSDPAAAAEAWAKEYRSRVVAEKLALAEHARAEQEKAEKETAVKTLVEKQEDLEFAESFVEPGENDMLVRQVAAKLEQNNIIIAEKNLRKFLQEIKFFTKRVEDGQYELRADMIKKGYAFYRSYYIDKYSGEQVHKQTVYITGLGYRAITKAIKTNCKDIFLKYGRFQESYL